MTLMLHDHLEFQYDMSQEMDKLQKKVSLRNSEALINSASYRSAGPSVTKAAAKGLKSGRRFSESENKLSLSLPAQVLVCPLEEARLKTVS